MKFSLVLLFIICSCTNSGKNSESSKNKVWNFSSTSDYTFDSDFISVNGKAELKDLDLNYDSNSEFSRGTKSNLVLLGSSYTIQNTVNSHTLNSSWAPQWDKLEALFRMEGNSFADSSTKNRNGVPSGTPTFTAGKIGSGAAHFTGSGDVAKVSGLSLAGDFSISLWVKRPDTSSDQFFIGQGVGSNLQGLHIGFRGDGTFAFAFWGNDITTTATFLTPNQWDHFIVVYDRTGQRMRIYRNGILDGERWGSGDYAGAGDLCIGAGLSDCSLLPGEAELDEVAIWSSILTQAEINTIHQKQKWKYAASYTSEIINAGLPFNWDTLAAIHSNASFEGRSCDDSLCSGETFSTLTPGALVLASNSYFQFKVNLESDTLTFPSFDSVDFSNGTQRFYPGKPAIENSTSFSFTSLSQVSIRESGTCTPRYRLSNDGGVSWLYFNGSWVTSTDDTQISTASDISANASSFPVGTGLFKFRAVLSSDSSEDCVIEEIALTP